MLVIFDVVGTLFSLERIKSNFKQKGVDEEIVELWFEKQLQSVMASTLANKYRPFKVLARSTLSQIFALKKVDQIQVDDGLRILQEMQPWEDTAQSLRTLRSDGHRLVVLTNGSQDDTEQLLEQWGLRSDFERIFSADVAKACKPNAALYEMVFRTMFMGAYDCCMVSAHGWDILGAESVGMNSVYVNRIEKQWPFPAAPSGPVISNLAELPGAISRHYGTPWTKKVA